MGRYVQAVDHFELVIECSQQTGLQPTLALVSGDYAEILLERNAARDSEKAAELHDESLEIARELGMKSLVERLSAL
jgi:hypothetical protein